MCHQVMWLEFSTGKAGRQDRQTAESTVLCVCPMLCVKKAVSSLKAQRKKESCWGELQVVREDRIQARNWAEGEKVIAHDRS